MLSHIPSLRAIGSSGCIACRSAVGFDYGFWSPATGRGAPGDMRDTAERCHEERGGRADGPG